jgi:hypothetical protein
MKKPYYYFKVASPLLILLLSSLLNSSFGQINFDGVNCNSIPNSSGTTWEWDPADAIVDIDDSTLSIPVSSDIDSLWFKVEDLKLYFAFNRAGAATGGAGNAGFKFLFNTDCDTTTGLAAFGGADAALFFSIQSGVVSDSAIYKWDGSTFQTSGDYFTPIIGGTSCTDSSNGRFFEISANVTDIYDVCGGYSCGGISLTSVNVHSGGAFTSTIKDTMSVEVEVFINDPPVAILDTVPATVCSGDTVTFDASASTENYTIDTDYDSIVRFEWDMSYDSTAGFVPTSGYTTSIITKVFNSTDTHRIALRTTDAFNCMDTTIVIINSYTNPTTLILQEFATLDSCKDVIYDARNSTGYNSSSILTYYWEFPDTTTSTLDSLYKIYSQCAYGYFDPVRLTVTDDQGCSSSAIVSTPVPVELIYFKGKLINEKAVLNWQTASENNNDYFEIERSDNGVDFKSIAQVPGMLHSMQITDYSYTDEQEIRQSAYYRLNQIDINGAKTVYEIVFIQGAKTKTDIMVYPNPSIGTITVEPHFDMQDFNISILDKCGNLLITRDYDVIDYNQKIKIDLSGYAKGLYNIIAGNETVGFKHKILLLMD